MSQRTRSISWFQSRIVAELSKKPVITTYLALSSLTSSKGLRNLTEQHNLDIALAMLLSKRQVVQGKNEDGFLTYYVAA